MCSESPLSVSLPTTPQQTLPSPVKDKGSPQSRTVGKEPALGYSGLLLRRAMPRYTVHVRGEWLAVPCQDGKLTVGWLGREAVRRYMKNKPDNGGFTSVDEVQFLVHRCKGLGLLDNEDELEVALEDNEFVEVGEWPSGEQSLGMSWRKSPPCQGTRQEKKT